jgi:hypothetical protein
MTTPSSKRAIFEGQNSPTRGILPRLYPPIRFVDALWVKQMLRARLNDLPSGHGENAPGRPSPSLSASTH